MLSEPIAVTPVVSDDDCRQNAAKVSGLLIAVGDGGLDKRAGPFRDSQRTPRAHTVRSCRIKVVLKGH